MEVRLHPLEKKHLEWLLRIRNHESTRSQLKNDNIFTLRECEEWFENLKSPCFRSRSMIQLCPIAQSASFILLIFWLGAWSN